jgi:hypothetical protein
MSGLLATLPATTGLTANEAVLRARLERRNDVIPVIIVIAIVVLLALAVTIVATAVILCAQHGGVLDGVISLNLWQVQVECHKI